MSDPIVIQDNATPFLRYMIAMNPQWMDKALKSLGYYMQKQIKSGIKAKSPGGQEFASFMDPRVRAQLEGRTDRPMVDIISHHQKGWKRKYAKDAAGKSIIYPPFGKLQKAIGYQYDADAMKLTVGYLSKSAVRMGTMMENGYTKPVTDAVRKFFWSHGVPISPSKTTIKVPPRPVMEPMRKVLMPQMVPYLESKLVSYWAGNTSFSPSATRKYKVYR